MSNPDTGGPIDPTDPRRRWLRRLEWPVIDDQLFTRGCTPGDVFDEDERPGADWAMPTMKKVAGAYGRWLGFLTLIGELDPAEPPARRVTPARVRRYLALLRELENSNYTIYGLFADLRSALRVMMPEQDFSWLTRPGGVPLRSRLKMKGRSFDVPSSLVLYEWGVDLMADALRLTGHVRRRVQYRDGLLIAVFAARARRHRAMTGLRLGHELERNGDVYRITLPPELVKTKKPDEFSLPERLTEYIDRYIKVERQELLAGQVHDAFWVNWDGAPLRYRGIDKRIRWLSAKRFGKAFGPHRFRHAAATSAAIDAAHIPGLGAAMLGISGKVAEEHYNRAKHAHAAIKYQNVVAKARKNTRPEYR